jgi:hypothetical protein
MGIVDVKALLDEHGVGVVFGKDDGFAEPVATGYLEAVLHDVGEHLIDSVLVEEPFVDGFGSDFFGHLAVSPFERVPLILFVLRKIGVGDALALELERHGNGFGYMGATGCTWAETKSSAMARNLKPAGKGDHDALHDAISGRAVSTGAEALNRLETTVIIDLERPDTWPEPLASYLAAHHDALLGWEQGDRPDGPYVSAAQYDQIVHGLRAVLQAYSIVGLHCTKLTEEEIQHILANGMQLPDGKMLAQRINQLVANGHITAAIADKLRAKCQADEKSRAGMVWFCFFRPGIAGESGIGSFFRFWGGEALYNSHDGLPETGDALERIGIPCLIEAEVPIASLEPHSFLDDKIIRRYLIHCRYETSEPVDHEDRVKKALPAACIHRIIRYPLARFKSLRETPERPLSDGQRTRCVQIPPSERSNCAMSANSATRRSSHSLITRLTLAVSKPSPCYDSPRDLRGRS